jgi:hypothetical protein
MHPGQVSLQHPFHQSEMLFQMKTGLLFSSWNLSVSQVNLVRDTVLAQVTLQLKYLHQSRWPLVSDASQMFS